MLSNLVPISELILSVRFPGEYHSVREFITPWQFHVQHKITELQSNGGTTPVALWDFVCKDVQYPLDIHGRPNEFHKLQAYAYKRYFVSGAGWVTATRVNQQIYEEWFDFPYEILSRNPMVADCDGTSILLCSLLRNIGIPAYVAIGGLYGDTEALSHAWVVANDNGEWLVWETTAKEAGMALPEENNVYMPLCYFNETDILVDPALYAELEKMGYVPDLGHVFAPFGIVKNDIMKKGIIESLCAEHSGYCKYLQEVR